MDIARVASLRSRCVRRQVGAVIVDVENRLVSTGYAGPPATWSCQGLCDNWCPRAKPGASITSNYDNCVTVHAEMNALLFVDRSSIVGGKIYITSTPCWSCCKTIANSGIARVIFDYDPDADAHRAPDKSIAFLRGCGLLVTMIEDTERMEH